MRFLMIFIATTFLMLVACKPAVKSVDATVEASKPDMTQIKADIQELENAWAKAQNAKDFETLLALYTDDAISMPDGAPSVSGKAAIKARMEAEATKTPDGLTSEYTVLEVYGDGDIVTEIGTGVTKDASGAVIRTGKYFAIWQKVDGKYLCLREIYNSDVPAK